MDSFVLLTPLLMLGVIALVRFVGCNQIFHIEPTKPFLDPPTNLQATPADQRVDLTWDYENGDATSFEISYHASGDAYEKYQSPDIVMVTTNGRQHASASIPNLTNGTTYFFKIMAHVGSDISSDSQKATATPGVTAFVNVDTPGGLRNDFSGWVGMTIQIGNADLTVTQLGRLVVANNVGMHDVKIVDPAAGNAVVAMVTVNMPAGPIGEFAFVPLLASVRLSAFHLYHLVTHEQSGGDSFLDVLGMTVTTTAVATITSAVYSMDPNSDTFISTGSQNQTYGPVNFRY